MAAHRDTLIRVALAGGAERQDAEDCVQEAMVKAALFPGLDRDRLLPFLVTVVKRVVVDHHRAAARRHRLTGDLPPLTAASHEQTVCDADEAAWLSRQLPLLTPREQEVLRHRIDGISTRQIAQNLSVSPKTVETLLARGRRRLELAWRSSLGLAWPGGCWRWLRRGAVVTAAVPVVSGLILALPSPSPADDRKPSPALAPPVTTVVPHAAVRASTPRAQQPVRRRTDVAGRPAAPERPPQFAPKPRPAASRPPVLVRRTTPPLGDPRIVHVGDAEIVLEDESPDAALKRCLDGLDLDGDVIGC